MMKLVVSIVIFSLCSFSVLAKNDVEAGRAKSASCVACHGAQGKVSVPMYPNLAGQNAMYLEQSLKAYKKGERTGGQAGVMQAYVTPLTDDDISDLAAYYASLKP
ncbi:TPA: cytochrome c [Yersinia enterocolitica]|uniref:c-type cytochrome n=1 Tax=Yersinia enterocolitica TaxID=630 RepID=UPI001C680B2C|nr:cytochrome c [Yersinia enterocolitica]MBW5835558.1 cytochrome c [Yersinia enterocolitica]MBX9474340.1 cytochrome c [Yersinia enterocolitica]MBX9489899.1 cytochrome c [Yersinia enterocolitica]MBX9491243.1 cytochrome c [Yersinia enterocolitica]HEN3567849.1 cytochrome c [Yersinia enterocolitica]